MKIKSNEPKLTQKQICNQLGFSDSTIKRYRDDISMDSPFKKNKFRKKIIKPNTTIKHRQYHSTNENTKNNELTKKTKKNDRKGGSVENSHRKDNIKFLTTARKMVDNV